MNPHWDDGRRRQEPQHLKSILKKVPKPAEDWRRNSQCPGPAVDEPSTLQQGLDPVRDGACLEVERVDVELARKRKELEEIEERIMHKKVSIALKHAKPLSLSSGFHAGFDQSSSSSLRDKVHRILQQRHPAGFFSQVRFQLTDPIHSWLYPWLILTCTWLPSAAQAHSPKDRRNSAGSSVNGLVQEQHPLKIRVKELMKRRGCLSGPPERTVCSCLILFLTPQLAKNNLKTFFILVIILLSFVPNCSHPRSRMPSRVLLCSPLQTGVVSTWVSSASSLSSIKGSTWTYSQKLSTMAVRLLSQWRLPTSRLKWWLSLAYLQVMEASNQTAETRAEQAAVPTV